ncbi:MAG: hypothetical protein ACI9X4_001441 [Glaciecola sp.]|jgi:hypothetical protein
MPGLSWVISLSNPAPPAPWIRHAGSQSSPLKQTLRNHLRTFLERFEGSRSLTGALVNK